MQTILHDRTRTAGQSATVRNASPALFFNYLLKPDGTLSLHGFVKRHFRAPTFNERYYTDIGNALLRPEKAFQIALGAQWQHAFRHRLWQRLQLSTEVYYNKVHDKIIAYPKGQQFRWTMLNLGRVAVRGLDVNAALEARPKHALQVALQVRYSYQWAHDLTDPADAYYNQQIPYAPHHSGAAVVSASFKRWACYYSFIYVGRRYAQPENVRRNRLQPWYTHDLCLQRHFRLSRSLEGKLTVAVNNIFTQQYEVIANYPMPGRTLNAALDINF